MRSSIWSRDYTNTEPGTGCGQVIYSSRQGMRSCHQTAIYNEIYRDARLDCFGANKVRRHLEYAPIEATEADYPRHGANPRQMFAPVMDASYVTVVPTAIVTSALETVFPTLRGKCGVPEAASELMVELNAVTAGRCARRR
jgi:hypothetical protein